MTHSSGSTGEELLGYLQQHCSEIPADAFSLNELEAIRALANCRREDDAVEQVRSLAREYQESSLATRLSEAASNIANSEQPCEQSSRKTNKIRIDSCRAARIAIFQRNPHARVLSIRETAITLEAPELFRIPDLPPEYGYKGGAARIALFAALGEPVDHFAARDLDLVRFGRTERKQDREMARKFMPEDAKHGYGVELVPSYREYLTTRDITINEVVYMKGKIILSPRALEDCLNQVLRPTRHVHDDNGIPPGKIVTKILRMCAQEKIRGIHMEIEGIPVEAVVTPFDIALHLERALQKGTRLATEYLKQCVAFGFLEERGSGICLGGTIADLDRQVQGGIGGFQRLSAEKRAQSKKTRKKGNQNIRMPAGSSRGKRR